MTVVGIILQLCPVIPLLRSVEGKGSKKGENVDSLLCQAAAFYTKRLGRWSSPLVNLPVIVCIAAKVELDAVEGHCKSNVDPPPHTPSGIAAPERPAIVTVTGREVLQQKTCVYGNQD